MFDGLAAGGVASAGMLMNTGAQKAKESQWLANATRTISKLDREAFHSGNRSTSLMGKVICQKCGSRFTTKMKINMQQICNECQLIRQPQKGQLQSIREESLSYLEDTKELATLHLGSYCDGCLDAIIGSRYTCSICPEYDLCGDCFFSKEFKIHTHNHHFSEIHLSQEEAKDMNFLSFCPTSHNDIYCDGCKEDILGIRMRCSVCPYFDLVSASQLP